MASGKIKRSHGVYFKLLPSTQDTLQRSYQFACVFEAKSSFRADYLQVDCGAVGINRGILSNSEIECGNAEFIVGIYLDGDTQARNAAESVQENHQELSKEVDNWLGSFNNSILDLDTLVLRYLVSSVKVADYIDGKRKQLAADLRRGDSKALNSWWASSLVTGNARNAIIQKIEALHSSKERARNLPAWSKGHLK